MNIAELHSINKHVFYPKKNKPFRKDATEFQNEAKRFEDAVPGTLSHSEIDNDLPSLLQEGQVISSLQGLVNVPGDLVFFCHGYKTGIQFGFKGLTGAKRLAQTIAKIHGQNRMLRCIFYCCSIAQDEDNWFAWFCDELERRQVRFWCIAHATAGHTTKNPYVKYRGNTSSYSGAAYLVRPKSPRWQAWRQSLETDFRFIYPYALPSEVTKKLGGMGQPLDIM